MTNPSCKLSRVNNNASRGVFCAPACDPHSRQQISKQNFKLLLT